MGKRNNFHIIWLLMNSWEPHEGSLWFFPVITKFRVPHWADLAWHVEFWWSFQCFSYSCKMFGLDCEIHPETIRTSRFEQPIDYCDKVETMFYKWFTKMDLITKWDWISPEIHWSNKIWLNCGILSKPQALLVKIHVSNRTSTW